MELLDAKFSVKGAKCGLDLVFRNRVVDQNGKSKQQAVKMAFLKGMPLEDFTTGLRNLADHIDNEIKPNLFQRAVKVITGND